MTLVLAALFAAAPLTLEGDPAHTSAGFSVKHMVVTTVRGEFTKVHSTLHWDREDPAKSTVEMKIDTGSINTNNEKRDAHLKSPDFFDAPRCPEITFKSNKVEKESGDKYKVTGDLTMHCTTRPVTLDVAFTDQPVKTPFGTTIYAASASGKLKRSDWGLNWNKTLESGGVIVSDEVKLDVDVEYIAKPGDAKKEAQAETKK
ncbi:MAG TPA: YceI family protein [Myxococcales bacterium]|nr:YceI family protein [Myxococcales bacterium]